MGARPAGPVPRQVAWTEPGTGAPVVPARIREEVASRIDLPPGVRVTQAQMGGVADAICQGFTDGYSWGQVKEAVKAAGRRYNVDVSDADAEWAVRQAVGSRCPHHGAKLP